MSATQTGAALLREGVAAAKAGDKTTARSLLSRAAELDPRNELGWLWLASLAETELQAIEYLRRVLGIDPHHEQAREFLRRVLLTQGIKLAKANDKVQARVYLMEASELDPGNETVWLWLSSVAEDSVKAEVWLRKALEINPANKRTIEWLQQLQPRAPSAKPVRRCPFCETGLGERSVKCPQCRTILALADFGADLEPGEVDRAALHKAVDRYRRQAEKNEDFDTNYYLGLAHLNLNQQAEALRSLHQASRHRPEDEEFKAQVLTLWRRGVALNRIARRERKALAVPRTILVIDDSATVRKLVTVTLERRGHQVVTANGAMEALAKLNELTPDLVLLDITLPHTDGYQICNLIKAASHTRGVPVVILSGKDGFLDKVRGRTAGAVGYVTKPFEPAALVKIVENYCNQPGSQEQPGRDGRANSLPAPSL
ncbi:MAG TPA: response regulator [Blastocatellia bacterium]|nr:response regulator [Blastocatellia bacterium]